MVSWLFYVGFMVGLWWWFHCDLHGGFMVFFCFVVLWWFHGGFMVVLWWFYGGFDCGFDGGFMVVLWHGGFMVIS